MSEDFKPDGTFVQGLARGLAVIRAFHGAKPRMTLTEIADICGINRAAVRRSLMTLEALGYVESDGRMFSLGPKILDLGFSYLSSQSIGARVQPLLRQASAETGETVTLGLPEGTEMVCVALAPGEPRVLTVGLTVGSRMPLVATAIGRAYLSALDPAAREKLIAAAPRPEFTARTDTDPRRIAEAVAAAESQGYAVVDEEFEAGVRAIAVPVRAHGEAWGALNVVVSTATPVSMLVDIHLPALRRCAEGISAGLA